MRRLPEAHESRCREPSGTDSLTLPHFVRSGLRVGCYDVDRATLGSGSARRTYRGFAITLQPRPPVATQSGGLRPPLALNRLALRRRGLTLFEVLISLVIFITAMAAIGQLVSNGVRGALQSRFQSQAAMMCESKLGEVVAGIVPLVSTQAVYPDDISWSWSLVVMAAPTPGLMRVEVTVKRQADNSQAKVEFTMARYVRDPQLYIAAQEEADRLAQEKEEAEQKAGAMP